MKRIHKTPIKFSFGNGLVVTSPMNEKLLINIAQPTTERASYFLNNPRGNNVYVAEATPDITPQNSANGDKTNPFKLPLVTNRKVPIRANITEITSVRRGNSRLATVRYIIINNGPKNYKTVAVGALP